MSLRARKLIRQAFSKESKEALLNNHNWITSSGTITVKGMFDDQHECNFCPMGAVTFYETGQAEYSFSSSPIYAKMIVTILESRGVSVSQQDREDILSEVSAFICYVDANPGTNLSAEHFSGVQPGTLGARTRGEFAHDFVKEFFSHEEDDEVDVELASSFIQSIIDRSRSVQERIPVQPSFLGENLSNLPILVAQSSGN